MTCILQAQSFNEKSGDGVVVAVIVVVVGRAHLKADVMGNDRVDGGRSVCVRVGVQFGSEPVSLGKFVTACECSWPR